MKLVAYRKNKDENYRVGVLTDSESIADVESLSQQFGGKALPANPSDFYAHASEYIEALQKILPETGRYESLSLRDVQLGMPLGEARKVICVGKNYREHVHEMKSDIPIFLFYLRNLIMLLLDRRMIFIILQ